MPEESGRDEKTKKKNTPTETERLPNSLAFYVGAWSPEPDEDDHSTLIEARTFCTQYGWVLSITHMRKQGS